MLIKQQRKLEESSSDMSSDSGSDSSSDSDEPKNNIWYKRMLN